MAKISAPKEESKVSGKGAKIKAPKISVPKSGGMKGV
jgi:hypothetical protein